MHWRYPIDYSVKLSLIDKTLYKKMALISLGNDFCLIPLGKCALWRRVTNGCKKNSIIEIFDIKSGSMPLTAHNWQKWKSTFLTCSCYKIYREEAVGQKKKKKIQLYLKNYDFCENVKFWAIL